MQKNEIFYKRNLIFSIFSFIIAIIVGLLLNEEFFVDDKVILSEKFQPNQAFYYNFYFLNCVEIQTNAISSCYLEYLNMTFVTKNRTNDSYFMFSQLNSYKKSSLIKNLSFDSIELFEENLIKNLKLTDSHEDIPKILCFSLDLKGNIVIYIEDNEEFSYNFLLMKDAIKKFSIKFDDQFDIERNSFGVFYVRNGEKMIESDNSDEKYVLYNSQMTEKTIFKNGIYINKDINSYISNKTRIFKTNSGLLNSSFQTEKFTIENSSLFPMKFSFKTMNFFKFIQEKTISNEEIDKISKKTKSYFSLLPKTENLDFHSNLNEKIVKNLAKNFETGQIFNKTNEKNIKIHLFKEKPSLGNFLLDVYLKIAIFNQKEVVSAVYSLHMDFLDLEGEIVTNITVFNQSFNLNITFLTLMKYFESFQNEIFHKIIEIKNANFLFFSHLQEFFKSLKSKTFPLLEFSYLFSSHETLKISSLINFDINFTNFSLNDANLQFQYEKALAFFTRNLTMAFGNASVSWIPSIADSNELFSNETKGKKSADLFKLEFHQYERKISKVRKLFVDELMSTWLQMNFSCEGSVNSETIISTDNSKIEVKTKGTFFGFSSNVSLGLNVMGIANDIDSASNQLEFQMDYLGYWGISKSVFEDGNYSDLIKKFSCKNDFLEKKYIYNNSKNNMVMEGKYDEICAGYMWLLDSEDNNELFQIFSKILENPLDFQKGIVKKPGEIYGNSPVLFYNFSLNFTSDDFNEFANKPLSLQH